MYIKITVFIAGLLCLGTTCWSQDHYNALDNWLAANARNMGGRVILMIWKDGKPVYTKSVNEMTRRQKMIDRYIDKRMHQDYNSDDYTANTRQPIASCSKWLSAALVMTFVDEGRLSLSDTVGKYLPVLSAHGKGGITIGECLSHLTGIREPPLKEELKGWKDIGSMDAAVARIATLPVEGAPGTVFHYSNAGLQIAGAVIEKIGGESFENLFAERIARPLSMVNTDFGKGRVALPAGGAFSTTEDYMHFLWMIRQKGVYDGRRILSEKSVADMQINRIGPDVTIAYSPVPMEGIGYGYGEWILLDPSTRRETGAVTSPGLFGSIPLVDNGKGYCAFLMAFYVKSEGREERLKEMKRVMDGAMQ
jgi:CubicO group peptidase (beta-lactamase class C family)